MCLRRMFGPKREEITGFRKLHNEHYNVYLSPNIIKMIKSESMRQVRNAFKNLTKPEEKRVLGRLGIDWKTILKWILKKLGIRMQNGATVIENSNEPLC